MLINILLVWRRKKKKKNWRIGMDPFFFGVWCFITAKIPSPLFAQLFFFWIFCLFCTGKRRLETLSVIVFSAAMFTATAQVLVQAITDLADISQMKLDVTYPTIGILAGTIVIKFILFMVCRMHESVAVKTLAQGKNYGKFLLFL